MSSHIPVPETEQALADAYNTLANSKQAPGKRERLVDELGERISSAGDSSTLSFATSFYEANASIIQMAASGLGSLDGKSIEGAISTFQETAKVVMQGLDALGNAHPFIAVAVVAFKLVVTLDMSRRQNNQKVMAVKIQMQQMMCTLFQLRNIRNQDEVGPDGTVLKDRIQPLIQQIANDIKECGSACDVYLKKSFLAKTLKSKIYESRLAGYAARFMDHKDTLDKSLTVHIALGINAANDKLDTQASTIRSIEDKIDMLTSVFRKLDTPRERDIAAYIEEKGGAINVVSRVDYIETLVKKSGANLASLEAKSHGSGKMPGIEALKDDLQKEVSEDVDLIMRRNIALFDKKLEVQKQHIDDAMERQNQLLVSVINAGTHDKIKDMDLQRLWKEMGWKGSVKARHFVLALREYFTDQLALGTPSYRKESFSPELRGRSLERQTDSDSTDHLTVPTVVLPGLSHDEWALQFTSVAHLQLILEAIDDDGTGFISIKEANTFSIERPKGWSLLHWIAYWAKGWEICLSQYKNKIFLILKEMITAKDSILTENRYYIESYLRNYTITGIEQILRSTKTESDYSHICPELIELTEAYVATEEERLQKNLERIGYDIDGATTVSLITGGSGRIERFLFPLLYLTLKRHLEVFYYAQCHVLDDDEISHMSKTLGSIFDVVEQRVEGIGALCRQVHVDTSIFLTNLSLGMFHDIHKSMYFMGSTESLMISWQDTSPTKDESEVNVFARNTEEAKPIFSFNPESTNNYQGVWNGWPSHSFDVDPCLAVLNGAWAGNCYSEYKVNDVRVELVSLFSVIQLKIEVDEQDEHALTGVGVSHSGRLEVYGRRQSVGGGIKVRGGTEEEDDKESLEEEAGGNGEEKIEEAARKSNKDEEIDLVLSFSDGYTIRLIGKFVVTREELTGTWVIYSNAELAKEDYEATPYGQPLIEEKDVQDKLHEHERIETNEADKEKGVEVEEQEEIEEREESESKPGEDVAVSDQADIVAEDVGVETENSNSTETEDTKKAEIIDDDNPRMTTDADVSPIVKAETEGMATEVEVEEKREFIRTFIFTRCPAEVCHYHDVFSAENKARARWAFAKKAVLRLVRIHGYSWSEFKSWGQQRRTFLDYYKRDWMTSTCQFAIANTLTAEDKEDYDRLKHDVPPANIRLCVETLRWSLYRLPFHYGITCDGCGLRLVQARYICLTCIDTGMTNSFDLCASCVGNTIERRDFHHKPDHAMIKSQKHVNGYFFSWLINYGRLTATRLKPTFQELSTSKVVADAHILTQENTQMLCGCCTKPITIPCFVCINCWKDTFICLECDSKQACIQPDGPACAIHRPDHHLLRINNLDALKFDSEQPDPTAARITALESIVHTKLDALEEMVSSRISDLEARVDNRMASFETLLRTIAQHFNTNVAPMEVDNVTKQPGVGTSTEEQESEAYKQVSSVVRL